MSNLSDLVISKLINWANCLQRLICLQNRPRQSKRQ
jgi:hypothetical protein